jgi:hypothetical protein
MDPRDVYRDDEAWIAKYRAALEVMPVQPSGGMRFRTRLRNTCNVVFLLLRKVLGNFTVRNPPKSVPSLGPMPVQSKPVLAKDASMGRKSPPEATGKPLTLRAGTMPRSGPRASQHAPRRTTA